MNSVLGSTSNDIRNFTAYATNVTADAGLATLTFSLPLQNASYSVFATSSSATSTVSRLAFTVVSRTTASFNFRVFNETGVASSLHTVASQWDIMVVQNGVVMLQGNYTLNPTSAFVRNF